jgi:polyphosphate kinase
VLCEVSDPRCSEQLREQLDLAFAPETAAWELGPDGEWTRTGDRDYQELLMHRLADRGE